jgi:chloramphenicol-sensitive protein RarD
MSSPTMTETQSGEATRGLAFALGAYLFWGLQPIFMKAVAHIPAFEVVAHRILWSVPIAGVVLLLLGRTADLKAALRSPRTLAMAAVTAAIITVNWTIYTWAIAVDRAVDTALGDYINPLVSVLMGAVLLGERFTVPQIVALALATLAVLVLTIESGGIPWISLALAITFAVYGYLRKTLPIGPSQGFFLEVLLLSGPCLAYIVWIQLNGTGHFLPSKPVDFALLLACGPITATPLLLYAFGAKLLRLSTLGLMQYLAPTMVLMIAVFVFGEPFDMIHGIAFGLIWLALIIYSWSMLANRSVNSGN